MLGIAAGFLNAVSTRLEIFNHRFAVLVGRYGREVSIVVVNIKLPAGPAEPWFPCRFSQYGWIIFLYLQH